MEREAYACDHGLDRSDLCAEIIIIISTSKCVRILRERARHMVVASTQSIWS